MSKITTTNDGCGRYNVSPTYINNKQMNKSGCVDASPKYNQANTVKEAFSNRLWNFFYIFILPPFIQLVQGAISFLASFSLQ